MSTPDAAPVVQRLVALFWTLWHSLLRYGLKFGVVGIVGYIVDVGAFNLLRVTVLPDNPIGAKVVAVALGTLVTWLGNRYWTFRENRRQNYLVELAEFLAVSVGGLLVVLLCLWISHYVLGFRTLLADNISTNVIGFVLATAFRFVLFRYWVYGHHRRDGLSARTRKAEAAALSLFEDEQDANRDAEAR